MKYFVMFCSLLAMSVSANTLQARDLKIQVHDITLEPQVRVVIADLLRNNLIQEFSQKYSWYGDYVEFCLRPFQGNMEAIKEEISVLDHLHPNFDYLSVGSCLSSASTPPPNNDTSTSDGCYVHQYSYGGKGCRCNQGYRATYRANPDRCVFIRQVP